MLQRRGIIRALNRRYIYGRYVSWWILLAVHIIEMIASWFAVWQPSKIMKTNWTLATTTYFDFPAPDGHNICAYTALQYLLCRPTWFVLNVVLWRCPSGQLIETSPHNHDYKRSPWRRSRYGSPDHYRRARKSCTETTGPEHERWSLRHRDTRIGQEEPNKRSSTYPRLREPSTAFRFRTTHKIHGIWFHHGASTASVVLILEQDISSYKSCSYDAGTEEGGFRSIIICTGWFGMLFHVHDCCRGRRETGSRTKVSGCLRACSKSQFHSLAGSANA